MGPAALFSHASDPSCARMPPHCPRLPCTTGKTVLLELAILRMLAALVTPGGQFQHRPGHLKSVYLAPSRALVQVSWRAGSVGIWQVCPVLCACWYCHAAVVGAAPAGPEPYPTPLGVQEKVRDWSERFAALGLTCRELTGEWAAGQWGCEVGPRRVWWVLAPPHLPPPLNNPRLLLILPTPTKHNIPPPSRRH